VWGKALEGFRRFRAGTTVLMQPRIAAVILLLCTLYVVLDGAGLYIIVRALGIGGITFWQALAVRCFGLAFYIILGSLEAASVGAFIGLGLGKSAAVSVILVNRVLSIAVINIAAVLVLGFLRDEWRSVRERRHPSLQRKTPVNEI
jgi:hypothetical protein